MTVCAVKKSAVDAFEQGFQGFCDFVNNPQLFPAVLLNPYDPDDYFSLYEEWECGYEYAGHLSTLHKKLEATREQRLFGPFNKLLQPPKDTA